MIRKYINQGLLEKSHELLGRPYSITGTVQKGNQIGRTIGFPTANLALNSKHKLIPPNGIYACKVVWKESSYFAMGYIGDRPAIKSDSTQRIEVHIFDFSHEIYGQVIKIDFYKKIRSDQDAQDKKELKELLSADKLDVLHYFKQKTAI